MVADGGKAEHGEHLIGGARCILAIVADINDQWGDDHYVNEVHPGVRGFFNDPHKGPISVIGDYEETDK